MTITIGHPQLQIELLPTGRYRSYVQLKFLLDDKILDLGPRSHPLYLLEKSDLVFQYYSYSPKFEKVPDDLIADIAKRIEKSVAMKFDEDMYGVEVIPGEHLTQGLHRPRIKNKRRVQGLRVDYKNLFQKDWF